MWLVVGGLGSSSLAWGTSSLTVSYGGAPCRQAVKASRESKVQDYATYAVQELLKISIARHGVPPVLGTSGPSQGHPPSSHRLPSAPTQEFALSQGRAALPVIHTCCCQTLVFRHYFLVFVSFSCTHHPLCNTSFPSPFSFFCIFLSACGDVHLCLCFCGASSMLLVYPLSLSLSLSAGNEVGVSSAFAAGIDPNCLPWWSKLPDEVRHVLEPCLNSRYSVNPQSDAGDPLVPIFAPGMNVSDWIRRWCDRMIFFSRGDERLIFLPCR